MDKDMCFRCRFWRMTEASLVVVEENKPAKTPADTVNGECRFDPPSPVDAWPVTRGNLWCGKFVHKQQGIDF